MTEMATQDVTVRAHLSSDGQSARGAIFVGRLGAFRFEGSRDRHLGWAIEFLGEGEVLEGLHEHLLSAALSAIGVAEGLHRHPPPRILSVQLEDLQEEDIEVAVDVRDIFLEAGIAQGFVSVPGKGRFTFHADRRPEVGWAVTFGLDYPLPGDVASHLEMAVLAQIEEAMEQIGEAGRWSG